MIQGKTFYTGKPRAPDDYTIETLPPPLAPLTRNEGYIPDPGLIAAANVALMLGRPLLLTGEPGIGKTQFPYHLAACLSGPGDARQRCTVRKFETKSTSQARDLFYTFDSLSAFKRNPPPMAELDLREFIDIQALGAAILDAFPADDKRTQKLLMPGREGYKHDGPRRSIVLIDEIDKAPSDFPNDILNEIDRLYFRVPELKNIGSPGAPSDDEARERADAAQLNRFRPIVILTSNEERGLPDAFLRRCIFFDIPSPNHGTLLKIVAAQLPNAKLDQTLIADALDLYKRLRGEGSGILLRKRPSIAELLGWLQVMPAHGFGAETALRNQPTILVQTLGALLKTADDLKGAKDYVTEKWVNEPNLAVTKATTTTAPAAAPA